MVLLKHHIMRKAILILLVAVLGVVPAGAEAKGKAKDRARKQVAEKVIPSQLPVLKPVIAEYDIYVGGLHLSRHVFREDENRFDIRAHARTRGFWGWMLPWRADLESQGRIEVSRFKPETHKNASTWKDETKTIAFNYDRNQNINVVFEPSETPSEERNIVSDKEKRGALDPLSGILQLLGDLAVNKHCWGSEPLFDGRRRFDLVGEDKGRGFTDPDEYGLYKGEARRCDVHFNMVAGEWKDRERSRFWMHKDGTPGREPFEIWLAQLSPDLPELAVRAESPSAWGRIAVHLKGWRYAE